jgi:hypothetical protein
VLFFISDRGGGSVNHPLLSVSTKEIILKKENIKYENPSNEMIAMSEVEAIELIKNSKRFIVMGINDKNEFNCIKFVKGDLFDIAALFGLSARAIKETVDSILNDMHIIEKLVFSSKMAEHMNQKDDNED